MNVLKTFVLSTFLVFVLVLAIAACGVTDESPGPASSAATATAVAAAQPALASTQAPSTLAPPSAPTATPIPTPTATPAPTATPTPAPTATAAPNLFAGVPGIVDPENRGWPREVQGLNGRVTIAARPERIHTVSLGHDEITYALVPADRVVAVGKFTQVLDQSNVAELAQKAPAIGRDPEQIAARRPDIVIASPFTKADLIKALESVGITVLQTELHNDPEGRIQDILLLGYVYGEELRALDMAAEVKSRYEALQAIVGSKEKSSRPRVLSLTSYTDKIYTAGKGSTEGSIIAAAGGINVAAEAGLTRNPTTSVEGIISMRPNVIFLPQPEEGAKAFREQLLANPALAEAPAIKTGRIYPVSPKFFTTLSFWNLRGAEELAAILWPDDLAGMEFPPFSLPE